MGRKFSYGELDGSFFDEACELLENAAALVVMAEKQKNVSQAIPEVFRTFHTIKGGAQMVGCEMLATFAHQMEDLLDQVRTGRRPADMFIAALVLDAMDLMEEEINSYRQGEHPDELAERQADILARAKKMSVQEKAQPDPAICFTVPAAKEAISPSESKEPEDCGRLLHLLFHIDEFAPMPEITEILIKQRLQEIGRIIFQAKTDCWLFGMEVVLQSDMEEKALQKYCDAADVREIRVKDLAVPFFEESLPNATIDEFNKIIAELDRVVSQPESSTKTIAGLIAALSEWGARNIAISGLFSYGGAEWDRAMELLKTGLSLWNRLLSTPEQRLLFAQLVQNLWECVYAHLENKAYFFCLRPDSLGEGSGLIQEMKRLVKGSAAQILVLDLSGVAVLEAEGIFVLLEAQRWLKERSIVSVIIARGEYRHRHNNAVEALSETFGELAIYASVYQACLFDNLKSD